MFEINSGLLRRMGWRDYSIHRGIGVDINFYEEDFRVKYFILFQDRKLCYVIKEFKSENKLQKLNEYKFIKVDYSKKKPKFFTFDFDSNIELMNLLRENLACNLSYQRFFQINSIIK